MAKYRITSPNGETFEITAPDDASPQQVQQFAEQQLQAKKPDALKAKDEPGVVASIGAGLGAGVGRTALGLQHYVGKAAQALGAQQAGDWLVNDAASGRQKLADEVSPYKKANPWSAGGGEVAGEILATLPVGGALAAPVKALAGAAPALASTLTPVAQALQSAGMSAAGMGGKAGLALRSAAGAAVGGASGALVEPGNGGMGAAIGGAVPGLAMAGGWAGDKLGRLARYAIASPQARTGGAVAQALDVNASQVPNVAAALKGARELVPGSTPTVAQVLQTPQAGVLQRVVHDSNGGAALRDALAQQNAARLAALEGVAPTAPGGYAAARQDLGEAVGRFAQQERAAAKARTSAAYESVPQDEAALYLPNLGEVRDKYFGRGVFTARDNVDAAVRAADELGTVATPVIKATTAGAAPDSLATAVRQAGGISITNNSGLQGELAGLRGDAKNLIRRNGGQSPAKLAEDMHQRGYIPNDDPATLLAALREDATGVRQYSAGADLSRSYQAAREAAMGEAPEAVAQQSKVTLREFDNLRKSIGQLQRAAQRDPARATEARSLGEMRQTLDDRLNQVVAGDGAIDEVLPIAWADALDQARKLKLDEVQRFMTGPQAAIFRGGADGQPVVQGGEIAAKFWGNRPGLADDVQSFRRLIDDNPTLLGQFRSMVTTEGLGAADKTGALTTKFAKWAEAMRPGLDRAFSADDAAMIQRIAQDIKRAEAGGSAGMARGSNTYQNANNALSMGMLDSPALKAIAGRIPYASGGLDTIRNVGRDSRARQFAQVLADPQTAAAALEAFGGSRMARPAKQIPPEVAALFYRGAPVLASDQ